MTRALLLGCLLAVGAAAALALLASPADGSRTTNVEDTALPLLVPEGVSVAGVDLGGSAPADAQELIEARFEEPLQVVIGARTLFVPPRALGATPRIADAVDAALLAREGTAVPLAVSLDSRRTAVWLKNAAREFDRAPVDAEARLRGLHPFVSTGTPGRAIRQQWAAGLLARALRANSREPVELPVRTLEPTRTRENFGPLIVIRREQKRLWLYRGMKLWRTFGVAVGQSAWPTPLGRFEIVVMWRNPWWFPPASPWAQGAEPIPPGPGNPLGTRWMGLSSPGVGIHGTPDPASIGYSASHGCIRMLIPQAEWLFNHVRTGTPVFIVRA